MQIVMNFIEYITNNSNEILERTYQHLWLTFMSLLIASFVGILTGISLTRSKKMVGPVMGFVSIIQTVPSVALLGFLLPLVGIGPIPAIIALFLYALLPIVRNTYTGITEIDPAVKEAATGMGMTNLQLLAKIELPLAISTIFAGIRIATVINVGIATLCALIASGGLGEFIFRGISLNNTAMILAGAIPAAILAIFLDSLLAIVQKNIQKLIKPFLIVSVFVIMFVAVYGLRNYVTSNKFKAGFAHEFIERSDGYRGLKNHYDLPLHVVEMDKGLMYQALKEQKVDVISGYTTDGRIKAFGFEALHDNKHFFPPYFCAPLINKETITNFPEIVEILNMLSGKLNDEKMRELNYRVDFFHEDPKLVAEKFLMNNNFKTSTKRDGNEDIIIGTKNFSEQYILAEMFALLIENYSPHDVEIKAGLGGTKICFEALKADEIQLYPEYTGTAFLVILQPGDSIREAIIRDKELVYKYVKENLKKEYQFEILAPLGFNNSYALIMRKKDIKKNKLHSITDLKNYLDANY